MLLTGLVRILVLGIFLIAALQNLGVELLPLIAGLGIAYESDRAAALNAIREDVKDDPWVLVALDPKCSVKKLDLTVYIFPIYLI